ncbi:hypothetical protein [Lacticaseibacillus paracasei]|uniref:hypothetical protein n=1 Tax=Lacticaseibacillus paracasei TaxID=1597 RepID=UPI0013787C4A|nr:hypothetical protein [Lacticaseibacillus paracasei]MCZ2769106.1 hypothetical protein [Lacticaseibacillus paracasei]MCZ2774615.1 hypothetical protein [Lacticaseibacillus paracasei]MCZ2777571.1 hypothetical protein [Lacticaseibacillus paracasei]MCZ2783654.1 hypothetical protein [Lacticaseibacillus paracasei]NCU15202.1 hypothetical protein [Lacticaseibacillus paracasei]
MGYRNKELLTNWQDNVDKLTELTKHSTTRTARKLRLSDMLNTISAGKILGASEHKINGRKLLSTHSSTTNAVPAFLDCLAPEKLPAFLKAFYPELLLRVDYHQACKIVESNLKQLPAKRSKCPREAKDLFVPTSKTDLRRDDKKLLLDCWMAINYATVNQFAGAPLVKTAGRGVYLSWDLINSMLKYPKRATRNKVYNALQLLQIAGFIRLAQDDELTPAGLKLQTVNKNGVTVRKNNVFILNDFDKADPKLITDNLRLDLTTRVSKVIIEKILGIENAKKLFPLVNSGVDEATIARFQQAVKSKGLTPLATLNDAVGSIRSELHISAEQARLYVNQLCQYKALHLIKLKKTDAVSQGYNLTGFENIHSSEKLLVVER